jgi:predicted DNA-binding transcriptional regulator AlpA
MQNTDFENNDVPGDLIRAKQLKKYVPVSERCLYLWQKKGLIPGYRIGKTVLFSLSEVLATIKKGGVQ